MIVSNMHKKYWLTTHKFGVEVPTSVKLSYEINHETGTDFWRNSIAKEIMNVEVGDLEREETPDQVWGGEAKV